MKRCPCLCASGEMLQHLISMPRRAQDAVRAEFPEVSKLLIDRGGKVYQEGNVRHHPAAMHVALAVIAWRTV